MAVTDQSTKDEGLRGRKKRETLQRIAETALRLFVKNGYEGTTLDDIAAEACIARRTFFYYFKSKEAILLAYMDGGYAKLLGPTILKQSTDQTPLAAVRNGLLELFSAYESEQAIVVYKLFESTDALKARMQATGAEMEKSAYEALCKLWPDPNLRASHRMVAMIAIGAMRLAKEAWRKDEGRLPFTNYLRESFATLEKEI